MTTKNTRPLPTNLVTQPLFTRIPGAGVAEVASINIIDLLEELWPGYWDTQLSNPITYSQTLDAIQAWCEEHGCHYYARLHEEFNLREAARETIALGLTRVVLEDLS